MDVTLQRYAELHRVGAERLTEIDPLTTPVVYLRNLAWDTLVELHREHQDAEELVASAMAYFNGLMREMAMQDREAHPLEYTMYLGIELPRRPQRRLSTKALKDLGLSLDEFTHLHRENRSFLLADELTRDFETISDFVSSPFPELVEIDHRTGSCWSTKFAIICGNALHAMAAADMVEDMRNELSLQDMWFAAVSGFLKEQRVLSSATGSFESHLRQRVKRLQDSWNRHMRDQQHVSDFRNHK